MTKTTSRGGIGALNCRAFVFWPSASWPFASWPFASWPFAPSRFFRMRCLGRRCDHHHHIALAAILLGEYGCLRRAARDRTPLEHEILVGWNRTVAQRDNFTPVVQSFHIDRMIEAGKTCQLMAGI